MRIQIIVNDKKVSNYMRRLPGKLKSNLTKRANRSIKQFIELSKSYAPKDTGSLQRGILKGKAKGSKSLIVRSVIWKDLNSRRKKSFRANKNWKNFVTWMHNSPYSLTEFNWKKGHPNFFDLAKREMRTRTFKGMSIAVDRAIK